MRIIKKIYPPYHVELDNGSCVNTADLTETELMSVPCLTCAHYETMNNKLTLCDDCPDKFINRGQIILESENLKSIFGKPHKRGTLKC